MSMFHVHSAVAWLDPEYKSSLYFKYSMKLSGMIAPVFMFLAGISIGLIAKRTASSPEATKTAKYRVFKRGLQLWLIGYGLHLVFYILSGHLNNWTRILKVDILHCIGLTMAVTPWLAWPKHRLNIPALLIFIGAPLLSMLMYRLPITDHVPIGIAAYVTIPSKLSLFPIIPYTAWIMLGLFIAPLFNHALNSRNSERLFWIGLILGAIAMWCIGRWLKWGYYSLSLDRWGTDTPQVKGVLHFFWLKGAFVLGTFAIFRIAALLFDRLKPTFFVCFGKESLFAYCLHLFVVYPILGSYFKKSLSVQEHMLASFTLTCVMFLLVLIWTKYRKYIAVPAKLQRCN